MDFSGGKTLSSTQANENSCVPTALGSNMHTAAELAFSCTFMHPLGIPENCQKQPNPLPMTNLSETEADSQCKKKKDLNSQLWKQLSLLNVVIKNRGMFDVPYSRCRDKSDDKACMSGDWKKFYHEWAVAKIALARLDEVGLFNSDGMWELCIKKSAMLGG